jgi:SAM-dependent methyltransferase
MNIEYIDDMECPECRGKLMVEEIKTVSNDLEGKLKCIGCKSEYEIKKGIPRFVQHGNYADSFGFEWDIHSQTQLDSKNGTTISRDRFFRETRWEEKIPGKRILEAGCGSGRFTEIALSTGAIVYTFDLSNAVETAVKNCNNSQRLHAVQADIYKIPFKREYFDKIFCMGVLQHTPDPERAFFSLLSHLKKGGEIVIDVYNKKKFYDPFNIQYKITKRMDRKKLYRLIKWAAPKWLPISIWLRKNIPIAGYPLSFIIPISNYYGILPLKYDQLVEWAILDTFDTYSPAFTNCQNIDTVRSWLEKAGLEHFNVSHGYNGIEGHGTK